MEPEEINECRACNPQCEKECDKCIDEERLKIVKENIGLWEIIDNFEEEQINKIEELAYSLITKKQIDDLYFGLV